MAHFAKLDENNVVLEIIVIDNNDILDENGNESEEKGRAFCEFLTGHARWKRTSYNTRGGVYYDPTTNLPHADQTKAYRLNYAAPGMTYNEALRGFVQTFPSVDLVYPHKQFNPTTGLYERKMPNIPLPDLQLDTYPLETYFKKWFWNVTTNTWIKIRRNESIPENCYRSDVLYPDVTE
jgi:hypothetical protein